MTEDDYRLTGRDPGLKESRKVLYENRSYFREISSKNSAKKALKEKLKMNETPICIMSSGMEFWARTLLDAHHIILRDVLESDEDEAVGLALEAKALLEKEMPGSGFYEFDGFSIELFERAELG